MQNAGHHTISMGGNRTGSGFGDLRRWLMSDKLSIHIFGGWSDHEEMHCKTLLEKSLGNLEM